MTCIEDVFFISHYENDYVLRNTKQSDKVSLNPAKICAAHDGAAFFWLEIFHIMK
jgi:hypothetical protein